MTLRLPKAMLEEMVAQALEELPNECCGIIVGRGDDALRLYRTRNAEASPFRYNIDPLDLLKIDREMSDEERVLVIYHSHVASPAYPSQTDIALSIWPGSDPPMELYPGAYYALVSLAARDAPEVRAYLIEKTVVREVELEQA